MLSLSLLQMIPDRRRRQGRRFDLPHLLLFIILGLVCGADSYRALARFMKVKLGWFRELTGVTWPRAPGHTGVRRFVMGLSGDALEGVVRRAAAQPEDPQALAAIAIDGKTLRGSLDRFQDQSALQCISALTHSSRLVLGHVMVQDGDEGGEIEAARVLIDSLGVQGRLFTLDALHAQKNAAGRARQRQRRAHRTQGQPAHAQG